MRSKMRQEEEEDSKLLMHLFHGQLSLVQSFKEHKRRMRDIYEKYGNQKAATSNYAAGASLLPKAVSFPHMAEL